MNQVQQKQRNPWTKEEDEALIYIKEELKVKKWTDVAKKLKQILNQHERKDKHCRDRYENFLIQSQQRRKIWTTQNDIKLIHFYLEFGNKWSQMAQFFNGMNGAYIKNKFYSRMRKGIRTINYIVDSFFLRNWKKLETNIIFKLVTCAAEKFDFETLSPIGQKLAKKINFIEQIVSKIFWLSFVDKAQIKKSPKQSQEKSVNPEQIQQLIEQISFIDKNSQIRKLSKINEGHTLLLNQKSQNSRSLIKMNAQYKTKIQQEVSQQIDQYEQIHKNSQKFDKFDKMTPNMKNKRVQIICNNFFQDDYKHWYVENLRNKQNICSSQHWGMKRSSIYDNEKIRLQSGYKQIIGSFNQTPRIAQGMRQNTQQFHHHYKQQISDKQQQHSQKQ